MQIQWDRDEVKAIYENMVSVIIKRLHPTVQRVDGSGGDGGRDLQLYTGDGLVVYELKSFTGRLSQGGRKRQIQSSLEQAKNLKPIEWHLVAPLDLTPKERDWFNQLTDQCPFVCTWAGKTWLDSEMSQHPEIRRYYLEDGNKEVIDLLRDLRADWDPSDALSTLARVGRLRNRLNERDPHYRYDFQTGSDLPPSSPGVILSVGHGDTRVDVHPRYPTAAQDRPINVTITIHAEATESAEAFQRALDYGDEAELPIGTIDAILDAPGGLGGEFTDGGLRISGHNELLEGDILIVATILAHDLQTVLAKLEFEATSRRIGKKGGTLKATDASGLVGLELRADSEDGRMRANFSYHLVDVQPAMGLVVARWLEHVEAPNHLRLELNGLVVGEPFQLGDSLVPESPLRLFKTFQQLQDHVGLTFSVPADITANEWQRIRRATDLLQPEGVTVTVDEFTVDLHEAGFNEWVDDPDPERTWRIDAEDTLDFRNRTLALGRLITEVKGHLILDRAQARAEFDAGVDTIEAKLRPSVDTPGKQWLVKDRLV